MGYKRLGPTVSVERPGTFIRERGTFQGDVSSPHAWIAFFDIALRALAMTDPNLILCASARPRSPTTSSPSRAL